MTQYYVWDKTVGRNKTSTLDEKALDWGARLQGDTALEVAQASEQLLGIPGRDGSTAGGSRGGRRGQRKNGEGARAPTTPRAGSKPKSLKQQVAAWTSWGEQVMGSLAETLKKMEDKHPLKDLANVLTSKQQPLKDAYAALKNKEILMPLKDINKQQQQQQQRTAATTPATTNSGLCRYPHGRD